MYHPLEVFKGKKKRGGKKPVEKERFKLGEEREYDRRGRKQRKEETLLSPFFLFPRGGKNTLEDRRGGKGVG